MALRDFYLGVARSDSGDIIYIIIDKTPEHWTFVKHVLSYNMTKLLRRPERNEM